VIAGKLPRQWFAESAGIVGQWTDEKLPDRRGDTER